MKPKYEIVDIFCKYGEEYKKTHAMNDEQRKVMAAVMACRTAQLGLTCLFASVKETLFAFSADPHKRKQQTLLVFGQSPP